MREKTKVTLRLRQEALDLVLKQGYATRQTLGEFLSQLVLDYHQRQGQPSAANPSYEGLRQVVDEAEQLLRAESGKTG